MTDKLDYKTNFAAIRAAPATVTTDNGEEDIMIELRIFPSEEQVVFAIVNGMKIYSNWIGGIVADNLSINTLQIDRSIKILSNGKPTTAILSETIRRVLQNDLSEGPSAEFQLTLQFEGAKFETEFHPTLMDGIWEFQEAAEPEMDVWPKTCYHCRFAHHGSLLGHDPEYRCYREVPEANEEIMRKGKQASDEARYAGTYTVSAFHTCAAWELFDVNRPSEPKT